MTNPFLTDTAADFHAAFADAGLADTGVLTAISEGVAVQTPCKVYVDREQATSDLGGVEFYGNRTVITLLREGIAAGPKKGDTITVGAEVFKVDRILRTTEAEWELLCQA